MVQYLHFSILEFPLTSSRLARFHNIYICAHTYKLLNAHLVNIHSHIYTYHYKTININVNVVKKYDMNIWYVYICVHVHIIPRQDLLHDQQKVMTIYMWVIYTKKLYDQLQYFNMYTTKKTWRGMSNVYIYMYMLVI